ncbi:helix-turn-helix transcriptional regulator [Rhodococcus sp. NPDC058514]|uniref:helix-turn-helix transcriptional regulator n=1 Tax=unclassified Rhodococcus (in: high G+C Gram-positive bacteria) TaxID=192944 RepID=UPI003668F428
MNRTDRLYALVEELRAVAPRPRSARRLAEQFEVSTRTIERDLSALQQAGVPIWAEPGRTGGYCIDTSHTLAPLGFTVDEALAVTIALGMLTTSPFRAAATSALRKVVAVMDQRTLHETAELASRIHLLDDGPVSVAPAELAGALPSGNVLRIAYRDRDGADTLRDVEPLGYVGKGRDWYLIGWCRLRDGIRAFRGDRVMSAETTGERAPRRSLRADDLDIAYGTLRSVRTGTGVSETPT